MHDIHCGTVARSCVLLPLAQSIKERQLQGGEQGANIACHCEPAAAAARQPDLLHACLPELHIKAALHNGEQVLLVRVPVGLDAAVQPPCGAVGGLLKASSICKQGTIYQTCHTSLRDLESLMSYTVTVTHSESLLRSRLNTLYRKVRPQIKATECIQCTGQPGHLREVLVAVLTCVGRRHHII